MCSKIQKLQCSVTKAAYESIFKIDNSVIIPITHADIEDHRKKREYNFEILRI